MLERLGEELANDVAWRNMTDALENLLPNRK
jgi:hypothetical protein